MTGLEEFMRAIREGDWSSPKCDWCALSKPVQKDGLCVVWHRTGWSGLVRCDDPFGERAKALLSGPAYG